MVESLTQPPPAPDASAVPGGAAGASPTSPVSLAPAAPPAPVPLDPRLLRSAIYRQYGAYLDVGGVVDDRARALDRVARDVAASLVQQRERVLDLCEEVLQAILDEQCDPRQHAEEWDLEALGAALKERFGFEPAARGERILERDALAETIWAELEKVIDARETEFSLPLFLYFARFFLLEEIDQRWIEHLKAMEALREGIHLRGYGQKDPKQEYKKEGFVVFGSMMAGINRNICERLFHMQLRREGEDAPAAPPPEPRRGPRRTIESGGGAPGGASQGENSSDDAEKRPVRRSEVKVGRNDPCPCGSGKKYKKCHGLAA
jgi:preprotein translocase subunit SecA